LKERNGQLSEADGDDATGHEGGSGGNGGGEVGDGLAVVCVDGSPAADEALRFTLTQMPRARTLVLAHGIRVSLTSSSSASLKPFGEDEESDARHKAVERRYLKMCRDADVRSLSPCARSGDATDIR
jgi:hypothetical protein